MYMYSAGDSNLVFYFYLDVHAPYIMGIVTGDQRLI